MKILGVDIGGTGVKGAPVDIAAGRLLSERFRVPTPKPATPGAVVSAVQELVRHFRWKGPIGCAFPAVIAEGVVHTASNIDESWIGVDAENLFSHRLKLPVSMINDADAAGVAEMQFGAGRRVNDLVLIVTLGTGIGSALFFRGELIRNTELGQIEVNGKPAERRASNRVREERDWSWEKWGEKVGDYLRRLELYLAPALIIVGGGVSKHHREFFKFLKLRTPIVPAKLLNDAGIIGAALTAQHARLMPRGQRRHR